MVDAHVGAIHWGMGNLPVGNTPKENEFPFFQQSSAANSSSGGKGKLKLPPCPH